MAEDTLFMDGINLLDQVNDSSELLQGLFKSNRSGRADTKIYLSLIEELLERRLLIEEFIESSKLKELIKDNRLYRGITISEDAYLGLEHLSKDEFSLLSEIEKGAKMPHYYQKWNKHYLKHYKNIIPDKKKPRQKSPKKVESVFDQFFRFKSKEVKRHNEKIEKIPEN